jgi:hypothetical protein
MVETDVFQPLYTGKVTVGTQTFPYALTDDVSQLNGTSKSQEDRTLRVHTCQLISQPRNVAGKVGRGPNTWNSIATDDAYQADVAGKVGKLANIAPILVTGNVFQPVLIAG